MATDERYSLEADTIEAVQCVKSWLKGNIVNGMVAFNIIQDQDDTFIPIEDIVAEPQ